MIVSQGKTSNLSLKESRWFQWASVAGQQRLCTWRFNCNIGVC